MNVCPPHDFTEVDKPTFDALMEQVNFNRDAWCGGEYYNAIGRETHYMQKFSDGSVRQMFHERRVGFHCDKSDRWYVDPTFFKMMPV